MYSNICYSTSHYWKSFMKPRRSFPFTLFNQHQQITSSRRTMATVNTGDLNNQGGSSQSTRKWPRTRNTLQNKKHSHKSTQSRPTHFLSFPVVLPTLTSKLLETGLASPLDPASLVSHRNLHITVGILHLPTSDDIEKAATLFQDFCSTTIQHQPLLVDVHQLDVMQMDPKKAHVLYARVWDRSKPVSLHNICDSLRHVMIKAGFMTNDHRPLKMHVTLINTVYGKKSSSTASESTGNRQDTRISTPISRNQWERIPFDATPILDSLGHIHWGTVKLDTFNLMKMGRTGPLSTYESVSCYSI